MAASPAQVLTGVVERIIFLNEENNFTIAELRPEPAPGAERAEPVTVVGALPGVECGETLHLTGDWTRHTVHGAQFKIAGFRSELPASVYGIRKYLGSGLVPGIGKIYANKIVDAFGTETFRILSEESGKLREVPGIGRKRASAIKQAWEGKRAERELYIFLQTYGVTPGQCLKLVNQYGAEAKAVLLREPYRVAREIEGIGFKTADRIAINLGFANDAAPRLDAGIFYALETLQEEGHTAYPEADFVAHAAGMLETSLDRIAARLEAQVAAGRLVRHPASNVGHMVAAVPPVRPGGADLPGRGLGGQNPDKSAEASAKESGPAAPALPRDTLIQLPPNDQAERTIARGVARIRRNPSELPPIKIEAALQWAEGRAGFVFHGLQRMAVRNALAQKLTILTGGPGTGKTTCLRALVDILKIKKVRVHLAAPTGRAAQRLAETTGGFASTLHRLLKFDPSRGAFTANQDHPLPTDFLIVDEASMLDSRLAAALLQAVPASAHLLLVGDIDQLPSVGAGNVLKDVIAAAGAPVTRLSVIYRQEGQSLIVVTAHAINSGDASLPPITSEIWAIPPGIDLAFVLAASAEDCLRKVVELCTGYIPQNYPRLHPINDVQVVAPMHKGVAGVTNLNLELQAALNGGGWGSEGRAGPPGPPVGRGGPSGPAPPRAAGAPGRFRPGDKIIQLRNDYDKNLFNGDIGFVIASDGASGALTAEFDGERHEFTRGELSDLSLAYAISIHKSQGSEYPVVIIPLLKAHFMMLERNLLYTAITRGRKKVFLVGEAAAYGMAVRNREAKQRITHLRQKLEQLQLVESAP